MAIEPDWDLEKVQANGLRNGNEPSSSSGKDREPASDERLRVRVNARALAQVQVNEEGTALWNEEEPEREKVGGRSSGDQPERAPWSERDPAEPEGARLFGPHSGQEAQPWWEPEPSSERDQAEPEAARWFGPD